MNKRLEFSFFHWLKEGRRKTPKGFSPDIWLVKPMKGIRQGRRQAVHNNHAYNHMAGEEEEPSLNDQLQWNYI